MKKKILIAFAMVLGLGSVKAQNNLLLNQYFLNPYLANPAMAGLVEGGTADMAVRSNWSGMPGAPSLQSLSGSYGFGKAGVGLNVNLDKAGLQRQTRVVATYAYHLPINDATTVHFGLSAGFLNQRIDLQELSGNPNDDQIMQYNGRQTYIDGDFGAGITANNLSAEFALVNLKNYFKKDAFKLVSMPVFYAAASYRFNFDDYNLEPKIAYRSFTEKGSVIDFGAQFDMMEKQLMFNAMYHSSNAASFGAAYRFQEKYLIGVHYTLQTGGLGSYTNGSFELNLGIKF